MILWLLTCRCDKDKNLGLQIAGASLVALYSSRAFCFNTNNVSFTVQRSIFVIFSVGLFSGFLFKKGAFGFSCDAIEDYFKFIAYVPMECLR